MLYSLKKRDRGHERTKDKSTPHLSHSPIICNNNTMDTELLVQMRQSDKCGGVRNDDIFNLHLGSGAGSCWNNVMLSPVTMQLQCKNLLPLFNKPVMYKCYGWICWNLNPPSSPPMEVKFSATLPSILTLDSIIYILWGTQKHQTNNLPP